MHKTCWYTTMHPLRVGALIGSAGTADLQPIAQFGFFLGAAFQIQDDLLNLLGTEREYGKEINGDLYEGKRTLPLIHLVRNARGAIDARSIAIWSSSAPSAPRRWSQKSAACSTTTAASRSPRPTRRASPTRPCRPSRPPSTTAEPGPDRDFIQAVVPYMVDRRT